MKRHECTKTDPWTPEKSKYAYHPDAKQIGEQENGYPSGDIVIYRCPNCGHIFKTELPQ